MDWDDIRVFLAVARAESLARGARDAGLDRSTASRRITALETALAAKVFLRTREGLRLSPAGARLLERAERMALEARALAAEAEGAGQMTGTVRVATTEAFAVMLVEEGLLELRQRYPDLVVELLGGNRPVDLARGEADVAVRVTKVHEANVQVRCLMRTAVALFASPSYVRQRGAPAEASEFAGHHVLLPSGELSALPEAKWLSSQPGVCVAFRSSSMPALVSATVAGVGIGALADVWGLRVSGLRRLFPVEVLETRPVWLAVAPESASRASVRLVAERIAETFARVSGARAASPRLGE